MLKATSFKYLGAKNNLLKKAFQPSEKKIGIIGVTKKSLAPKFGYTTMFVSFAIVRHCTKARTFFP
jgi:hypothetical protein